MKPSRIAGFALLGALVLVAVLRVAWIAQHIAALQPVSPGQAAADFQLPLLAGGEFRLGSSGPADAEAVTLVDFWATWCGPCREELPHVEAVYRRYQGKAAVRMVAVDVEPAESRPMAERIARELGLTLPIALGGDHVAEVYKIDNLPSLLVVDKKGRIGRVLLGVHDEDEIAGLIDEALKAK